MEGGGVAAVDEGGKRNKTRIQKLLGANVAGRKYLTFVVDLHRFTALD